MIRLEVPNKKIHGKRKKINKIKKNKKNCEKVRPMRKLPWIYFKYCKGPNFSVGLILASGAKTLKYDLAKIWSR